MERPDAKWRRAAVGLMGAKWRHPWRHPNHRRPISSAWRQLTSAQTCDPSLAGV